jgi:hypothetical protein
VTTDATLTVTWPEGVWADGCIIDKGAYASCEHGWRSLRLEPGGSLRGGYISLKGGEVVAPAEGGVVIGPCPQCP